MKNNYYSIFKILIKILIYIYTCVNKFLLQNCLKKKNFRINNFTSNVLEYLDEKN